jgi:O-antigen ligase
MTFRFLVVLAYFLYVANIGTLFHIGSINAIEKSAFLAFAISYALRARIDWGVLNLGGLLIACVIALGFLADYGDFSWSILIGALNQIIILFLFLSGTPCQRDKHFMLSVAAVAPLAAVLLGLVYSALGIHTLFGLEFGSGTLRFQGSLIPAFLSGLAMCGTFASVLMFLDKREKFLWFVGINFVVLLLAGGRMPALVTILTCAGAYLTSHNITASEKILGIGAWTLVSTILVAIIVALSSDTLFSRIGSSGMNGRDIMWPYLTTLGNENYWTGIGFGHQYFATPHSITILLGSSASHNDYLRLFVELGFPGSVFFYAILTYTIFYIWINRYGRKQHNILICYAGILMLMAIDNTIASVSHFFLLIFGSLPVSKVTRAGAARGAGTVRA